MTVTVYTKPDCQPCKGTKRRLDKLGIDYTTVELDGDLAARFRDDGLASAPVVVVDLGDGAEWKWCGMQPTQIDRLKDMLDGADVKAA